jgi:hypothetical protein
MRAISAGETTRKRNAVAPKRTETATVKRPVRTTDNAGGFTTTMSTIATYSCRVATGTPWNFPVEMLTIHKIKATSVWTIALPCDATITQEDIIEINGADFEVIGHWDVKRPMTEYKVLAMRVE